MAATAHPIRHRLEYGAVVAFGALVRALPLAAAQVLAWPLARLAYALLGSRRREAKRRLRLVLGPDVPERMIRRAAWISLRNTAFNLVDMLRIRRFDAAALRRQIPQADEAIAHLRAELAEAGGRGVVLALPHCGNWDLAGSIVELAGLPIFSVAAKQRNPFMNDLMNRMRGGHGMEVLERDGGPRVYLEMLRRIRRGQVFAILPDTRSRTPALAVPFLGGTANLARGMGLLACQAGAPIVPLVMRRVAWRRFEIEFFPTLRPDPAADRDAEEARITREVLSRFDAAIRATPEQWFWYNKRWVLDPVAGSAAADLSAGPANATDRMTV